MPTEANTVLSDEQIAELAERPWFWPREDQWRETPLPERHVLFTVAERDALCATVKVLRVERDDLRRELEEYRYTSMFTNTNVGDD